VGTPELDHYAFQVLQEIAAHRERRSELETLAENLTAPARVARHLARRTWAAEQLKRRIGPQVERMTRRISEVARSQGSWRKIEPLMARAHIMVREPGELAAVPLSRLDDVTAGIPAAWLYGAVEGGAVGLIQGFTEWQLLPFIALAAVDAGFTLYLAAREAALMAGCYGFKPEDPEVGPLLLEAMTPVRDWAAWEYLGIKSAYAVAARQGWRELEEVFVRRMTVLLTDKELSVLVPVAGAVTNAAVNGAFLRGIRSSTRDYFRLRWILRRYGEDAVREALPDLAGH
jgi:hypothetical protein